MTLLPFWSHLGLGNLWKWNRLNKVDNIPPNKLGTYMCCFVFCIKDVWCTDANVLLQPAEDGWMVMLKHSEDEWIAFLRRWEKGWMVRLCHSIKERAEDGWLTFSVFVNFRTDRTNTSGQLPENCYLLSLDRRQVTTTVFNQNLQPLATCTFCALSSVSCCKMIVTGLHKKSRAGEIWDAVKGWYIRGIKNGRKSNTRRGEDQTESTLQSCLTFKCCWDYKRLLAVYTT